MARGQYELIPAAGRPRPAFGPPRPPAYPPRISPASSPNSASSSPTSPFSRPTTAEPRAGIVIFSITQSDPFLRQIEDIKSKLGPEINVEEIHTVDEAVSAFARKPNAVFVSEDALDDPSLGSIRSVAAGYVRDGGNLITEPSQIPRSVEFLSPIHMSANRRGGREDPIGEEPRDRL